MYGWLVFVDVWVCVVVLVVVVSPSVGIVYYYYCCLGWVGFGWWRAVFCGLACCLFVLFYLLCVLFDCGFVVVGGLLVCWFVLGLLVCCGCCLFGVDA